MSKSFEENLNSAKNIFVELQSGNYKWWENLKKNEDISIQVRKENTIDVYYNGGAILSSLKYNEREKRFGARIHSKYIPLKNDTKYKLLSLTSGGVKFPKEIKVMDFSQFEDTELQFIKNRIKKYHNQKSEKAIQFNFIANDPYIIDAEFQLPVEKKRIDLIRLDKTARKIVLIEVKKWEDSRLYTESKEKTHLKDENIYDQLKKYHEFAVEYDNILKYYIKVLQVKKDLGLVRPGLEELSIDDWQVECKPLLVIGNCEQAWINQNAANIDKKIKTVAYGAYYLSEPKESLDLLVKSMDNRHIF